MSEPPIPPPPSEQPPIHSPYPRGNVTQYGSATNLRLLKEAYFQIYWMVAGTVGIGIPIQLLQFGGEGMNESTVLALFFAGLVLMFAVNFTIAFFAARKVVKATGKSTGYAVMLAFFSMLLSPCCLGLIGCIVIQQAVTIEVKRYGMRVSFLGGLKKRDFDEKIQALEAMGRS